MLLTDARRAARTRPDGDARPAGRAGPRAAGTAAPIAEGVALITGALAARPDRAVPAAGGDRRGARRGARPPRTPTGRRSSRSTGCSSGSPRTRWSTLNRAVAVAMVDGPRGRARAAGHARRRRARSPATTACDAVRAHLLELAGDARGGPRALPARRPAHDQPARAALPAGSGRAPDAAGRRRLTGEAGGRPDEQIGLQPRVRVEHRPRRGPGQRTSGRRAAGRGRSAGRRGASGSAGAPS